MNETIKNLLERRSVRGYKEDLVPEEVLNEILEAGEYAPSGMGQQGTLMVVTQNPELVAKLSKMNADVMGTESDPFYGAPTVVVVFADSNMPTCVENGSLVMGNLMNAAHALGVDSCWIHRAREVFASEEGKALKAEWGVPESYVGIGHCVLGYRSGARPYGRAIMLLRGKGGTGKDKYTFLIASSPQALIEVFQHFQRIGVQITMEATQAGIPCRFRFFFLFQLGKPVTERRFRCVHPPGIHTHIVESLLQVLPKDSPCGRIINIKNFIARPCRFIKQCADGIQRVVHCRFSAETRPYGKHEVDIILLMQFVNDLPGVIKMSRMEGKAVPMGFVAPVFPILHDIVQRDSPFTIFLYDCFQLIERFITLLGLPKAVHPFSKHRYVSRQLPVTGNDFIHILTIYEVVIGSITHFGSK